MWIIAIKVHALAKGDGTRANVKNTCGSHTHAIFVCVIILTLDDGWSGFVPCRSSLNPNLYQPTFAGFVDTDIAKGKISLRTLVYPYILSSILL